MPEVSEVPTLITKALKFIKMLVKCESVFVVKILSSLCRLHHCTASEKYVIIPAFFEEKKEIMCYRSSSVRPSVHPSVRPSASSLPASPHTLLMLESTNLYA